MEGRNKVSKVMVGSSKVSRALVVRRRANRVMVDRDQVGKHGKMMGGYVVTFR